MQHVKLLYVAPSHKAVQCFVPAVLSPVALSWPWVAAAGQEYCTTRHAEPGEVPPAYKVVPYNF